MRRSSAQLVSLMLVLTACGPTAAPTVVAAPDVVLPSSGPVYSETAAHAIAKEELHRLRLPPGAVPLQSSPLPHLDGGNTTPAGGVTFVMERRWWRVPGTQAALAAYESGHPPVGFTVGGGGSGYHDVTGVVFDQGPASPVSLVGVSIAQDGSSADLVAEVYVDVTPHRTRLETIPATVTTATLAYDRRPTGGTVPRVHRGRPLTPAEVREVAAALNVLIPFPGLPESSALPPEQEQSTLTASYGGHQVEFDVDFFYHQVNVLVDGQQQPFLDHDDAVAALTAKLLDVKPLNP